VGYGMMRQLPGFFQGLGKNQLIFYSHPLDPINKSREKHNS
jgi:hypothetical protein